MDTNVDIVLLWVDGNDPAWQEEKNHYLPEEKKYKAATSDARFRDWENLQYFFRGVEKNMPWVNKIHFVTWGHLPKWLNTEHPKLHIVKHTDFIPKEYLPTFNSHTIELNMHRIPGLAEHFIEFNDDMFIISKTTKEDYFEKGLPKDIAALTPYIVRPDGIAPIVMNNLEIINKYFSVKDIRKNKKWFSPKYGKYLLRTLLFSRGAAINGIYEPHNSLSLMKSTFEELWEKEGDVLDATCRSKFREKHNVNPWLLRDWQLMTGRFIPKKTGSTSYNTLPRDLNKIIEVLQHPKKVKCICINDSVRITDFDQMKAKVNQAFEELFPEKSNFEK
ncbi:capsule biosynthesis protein CapG [Streptococcus sp. KCJ4932]|uniref:Stealth CR1 domain-containing protein n=1 Tax=Streptococcus sp. KCJ4932 TaxID=2545465 RepID=UPI001054154B|nr:Stealth CR1 domain-containing protein [Streptococcus sp. KCJ4932]TDE68810.1 capsule biosynthesis protein CapG [Streptococcus sp. KCJ4932]